MGYNLVTRCASHGESAFIARGHEVEAIKLWLAKHKDRSCMVEWAVDNNHSAPRWADDDHDLYLPDDLRVGGN
jgi:hypothetical protein